LLRAVKTKVYYIQQVYNSVVDVAVVGQDAVIKLVASETLMKEREERLKVFQVGNPIENLVFGHTAEIFFIAYSCLKPLLMLLG